MSGAEYLLDNYVPVRDVDGFVLMARQDSGARADVELDKSMRSE